MSDQKPETPQDADTTATLVHLVDPAPAGSRAGYHRLDHVGPGLGAAPRTGSLVVASSGRDAVDPPAAP